MKGAIAGMKPVVVGMIGAAVLLLLVPSEGGGFDDAWSWGLFIVALIASHKKVNPILLIILSAIAGIAIYYLPTIVF